MTTNDQFPTDRTDEWEARQDAGRQVEAAPTQNGNVLNYDATKEIRARLHQAKIDFTGLPWLDTESLIEDAILPLRDEIKRLRELAYPLLVAESTNLRLREELERAQVASECAVKQMQAANAEIAQLRADCVRAEAELKELRSAQKGTGIIL